ncbi:MAG: tetratricopeptide repeat protein [Kiritimatiellae bacterium]|nr:tetratricopeptide repeat protein [Kiritimatiellia bacterium]
MAGGRQSLRSRLYAALFGVAVAALSWAWQFDSVPPDLMEHLSVAAGLRPPTGTTSLLWQYIAGPLCRNFGIVKAEAVLRIAGHVSLGVMAVLSVLIFEMLVPAALRRGEHVARWWRAWVRFVLFQGAALFCCSDPVWKAFCWFSPSSLHVLLAAVVAYLVFLHVKSGRQAPLVVAFEVLGLFAVDTPMGLLLLFAIIAVFGFRRWLRKAGILIDPNEDLLAKAFLPWRLTFSFLVGAVVGMALEVQAFKNPGGLEAFGWSWGDYALAFPLRYLKTLLNACSPAGLFIFFAVVVSPVLAEYGVYRRATDDEKPLVYFDGLMFLVCGLVAFSQLSGSSQLWFWTWAGESGCVRDDVLKCVGAFLCSLAVVWSISVFTIELYLRNVRRIVTQRFQDETGAEGAVDAFKSSNRVQRIVRIAFLFLPVLILGCVVPFRAQRMERAMLDVVAEAARETADECRDVEWLFTDGGLDAAVELAAAEKGGRLIALSMMGGAEDPREIYMRTRGVTNAEDRALLKSGAADALRTWVRTRPDMAKTYAVQIGFELWQRDGRPVPDCSGLVARPEGFSPEEVARGAEAGRALARRVLAVYDMGDPEKTVDRTLRNAFLFTQWRLAILARHRANAYDARGDRDLAMEETFLADELDGKNAALDNIRAMLAWGSRRKLERMTSREGLKIALYHADFALARMFARRILDVSPEDPAANFAIGMDFFVQRQYVRAQAYLERCLEQRPDDPAVLNNIAQCRLRKGDPKGALPYIERAKGILPDAPEIRRTYERVRAALAEEGR